ncbi:uncharacterized protein LOC121374573 [Gigantopelta aegis]|uniref:uncharacterized protein LOC121374573 n=1 Tax=Gigantopelta aegis TaxID=1735272 RepID=UPI001B887761|nr:uncharacterized protein LOC121374573 [Gigantopelta aegis]
MSTLYRVFPFTSHNFTGACNGVKDNNEDFDNAEYFYKIYTYVRKLEVIWFTVALVTISCICLIKSQESLRMPGDVTIGGLFQVMECPNDIEPSSLQVLEAVRWFFKLLNKRNYIPGVTIGFHAYKTCGQPEQAMRRAIDLLEYYSKDKTSTLLGVIGPELSSEVQNVSSFFSSLPPRDRLLQLNPTATAATLVNPVKYNNLYHFIPSDSMQVEVIVQLMLKLEWNYIDIVFESGAYGSQGATALYEMATKNKICVVRSYSLPFGANDYEAIDGFLEAINVRGVVFFGRSKLAQNLLVRLDHRRKLQDIIPDIEFIFSETLSMSVQSLKHTSGSIIDAAKGSLVASPPYRNIISFSSYWNRLFSNASELMLQSADNPWLKTYFESSTSCTLAANTDVQRCLRDSKNGKHVLEQSLYVQFSLLAAASIAETIKRTHTRVCGGLAGMCNNLKNIIRADMISNMADMRFEVEEEFSDVFQNYSGITFAFANGRRELSLGTMNLLATYEVQNFIDCGSDFCFKKVASFANDNLNVSKSDLRAYTTSGDAIPDNAYPAAQCPGDCTQDCEPRDLDDHVIFIPGDVYVVGLIPIYRQDGSDALKCGIFKDKISVDLAESLIFAMKSVNSNSTPFPVKLSKKVGLIVLNTCNSPMMVKEKLLRLQTGRMKLASGVMSSNVSEQIIGYVGALGSSISISAAQILTHTKNVQISFSSTNPSLSNRELYPFFMRTCTPDQKQALAIIDIIKKLKSEYIQIVHSNEAYGRGGKEILEKTAKENDVCVVKSIEISDVVSSGIHNNVINELWKNRDAKVVIIFVRSDLVEKVMAAISEPMEEGEFFFIGSETWGRRTAMLSMPKLRGRAISLAQDLPSDFGFDEYMRKTELNIVDPVNPWLAKFVEKRANCYLPLSFSKKGKTPCTQKAINDAMPVGKKREPWVPFAIAAFYSLIHGYDSALQGRCASEPTCSADILYQEMLATSEMDWFNIGQDVRLILNTGDGNVGYNILYLNDEMAYQQIGAWTVNQFSFDERNIKALDTLASRCPNEVQCNRCQTFLSKAKPVEERTNNLPLIVGVSVEGLLILLLGVACLVIHCRWKARHNHYVNRAMQYKMTPDYITAVHNESPMDAYDVSRMSNYDHIPADLVEMAPPPCGPSGSIHSENHSVR